MRGQVLATCKGVKPAKKNNLAVWKLRESREQEGSFGKVFGALVFSMCVESLQTDSHFGGFSTF